jgi:putative (di)nucleoside polyphosphate hydrolase|tara:strand:+ start:970 stop:1446 length:477 start_codon:yes stop_codon:yes gene_type:complete
MLDKFKNLPLRKGVGIILLNSENKVFVARRIDNPKNFWQMPQGGVDKNEDFLTAALRELKEETNIENVELIKELDGTTTYELPDNLLGIIWKGKYRGQKQKWFLMRFKGNENEINLRTKHPEFLDWQWIELDKITKYVVNFKLDIYEIIKNKVKKIIN